MSNPKNLSLIRGPVTLFSAARANDLLRFALTYISSFGSPSVNMFPVQFLVLCLSDLYTFRCMPGPQVSAVRHCQQRICGSLLLVQVQKS